MPDPSLTPIAEPRLVSGKVASSMLGISPRLLWSMTNSGEIPHIRLRRRVMYDPRDLRELIDANKTGAKR